ncbi:SDR family oxidoreductase [Sphingomonas sp.]|uniref:SDR family NAD(P)-dependent oxidoreductase n=1 Tax=Sphingomonas sp. TaxID=28214 RepID=UPI003421204B
MSNKLGTAVVTGASSGIGAVYADRLARRGYDLVLVARRLDRLEALADRIEQETGSKISLLVADLTDANGVATVEKLLRDDPSVTLLVNNAGMAVTAPFLDHDPVVADRMIRLNITAPTLLARAAGEAFAKRRSGTIINISSVTALAPELLEGGVYASTKAYLLSLSQAMQHELGPKGITVQAVLPGATRTDFWADAGTPVEHLPQEIVMSSEDMVDAALAGLDQGELITIPPLHDIGLWKAYDAARRAFEGKLSTSFPAARYGARTPVNA